MNYSQLSTAIQDYTQNYETEFVNNISVFVPVVGGEEMDTNGTSSGTNPTKVAVPCKFTDVTPSIILSAVTPVIVKDFLVVFKALYNLDLNIDDNLKLISLLYFSIHHFCFLSLLSILHCLLYNFLLIIQYSLFSFSMSLTLS